MLDSRWTDHADRDEERKEEQKRHLKRVDAGGAPQDPTGVFT